MINLELALRKCQVELRTSMANAVKTGNFRANSFMVAHSFSILNVPFTDATNMTSFNKTELDILEDGHGIPLALAKKLAENKFHAPVSTNLLRHQFNNWYGILQICFGDKSLVAREAKSWIHHIDKNELAYNARFKGDADFGAKLLGAVDLAFSISVMLVFVPLLSWRSILEKVVYQIYEMTFWEIVFMKVCLRTLLSQSRNEISMTMSLGTASRIKNV